MSWELDGLARKENEFKDIYAELSEQCKKFVVDLLDQCRSSEEVWLIREDALIVSVTIVAQVVVVFVVAVVVLTEVALLVGAVIGE